MKRVKFCWNIRNVTFKREEKDRVEKGIGSLIIKNGEYQVHKAIQPHVSYNCK